VVKGGEFPGVAGNDGEGAGAAAVVKEIPANGGGGDDGVKAEKEEPPASSHGRNHIARYERTLSMATRVRAPEGSGWG
jgi:hypothetical protein